MSNSQPVRSGAELVRSSDGSWLYSLEIDKPTIVFIHGFTSHGMYLTRLANHVGAHHYISAIFNYDSYLGIDRAARDLEYLLRELSSPLSKHGLVVVGHSMGGLVARYFAKFCSSELKKTIRGVATLGTPHRGTLSRRLVQSLIDWGEAMTSPNPFARKPTCVAAQQLTGSDREGLVTTLNSAAADAIPMLSVSGGMPFLHFGTSPENRPFAGVVRNFVLQRLLSETPNDGLVVESSSDSTRIPTANSMTVHQRNYPAFDLINHSHLIHNQQVANVLVSWLQSHVPNIDQ